MKYFRTKGLDAAEGLIENFRLGMLPANRAVREDFGIVGDDEERRFMALKWMWDHGAIDKKKLTELCRDGPALTLAVNVGNNPFVPVTYETIWDEV